MRATVRSAVGVAMLALATIMTACAWPPPNPLPQLPPYDPATIAPPVVVPSTAPSGPSATPTDTASQTPQPSYPIGTPTPIPGFPTDHTVAPVNSHIAADTWAFIQVPGASVTSTVAVKVNGLWQGPPGSLGQGPSGQPTAVDMTKAVPFYLSWSYVVIAGDYLAVPDIVTLPAAPDQTLYAVTSPFIDRDCPDYTPKIERGIGVDVRHCNVVVTDSGASVIGLALPVPGQQHQYWYFDAPPAVQRPA